MRYCEFKSDYYIGSQNTRALVAKEGERGVLDGYTSEPNPRAIVILDSGDIVIVHTGFIKVRYMVEGGERGSEKFFECYYNEEHKND